MTVISQIFCNGLGLPPLRTATPVGSLLVMTVFLAGCGQEPSKVEAPAPVRVATIAFEPLASSRSYPGVIDPRFESDLGFRVAGKIVERSVNIGDSVKAGQLIARLDPTDYKLNVEAQEADLAAAKSNRASAVAAEARYRALKEKGWIAQAALDERTSAADDARGRVKRIERTLEVQRNQVAYTELRAEREGVISAILIESGQVVTSGQVVARVARLDELEAVVSIPEQSLADLKSSSARVELWPKREKSYRANLREVAAQADSVSRTFEARFTILGADDDIRLGKTANVVLTASNSATVARLPLSAVMNDARGPLVWVVGSSGDRLQRRPVAVQSFEHDTVLISAGLNAGERVVTLGTHMLDENRPIRVIEDKTQASVQSTDRVSGGRL